jgi:hypothetical protein
MADKVITDFLGRPLGVVKKVGDKTTVTDWVGKPLGSADKSGTRDFLGKPVSPNNVPEILIKKSVNE